MPFIQSGGATSQLLEATGGVLYIPPSGALKGKCSKIAPPRNSPCSSLTNSVSEVAPRTGRTVCNGDLAILQQVQELEGPMRYRLLPAVVWETAPTSGPQETTGPRPGRFSEGKGARVGFREIRVDVAWPCTRTPYRPLVERTQRGNKSLSSPDTLATMTLHIKSPVFYKASHQCVMSAHDKALGITYHN
ncbi:hypothetical protein HPB51_015601 [Rhipicephalus microplus]|uniref:Uncharacterized protein n=1 Tax=Rhipicephalus microplus TaxID=6941 RepID=A0A9J6DH03_RHIMP|nr:hypothetical protein HPB51_015601 [Rhipicephalus microplus]